MSESKPPHEEKGDKNRPWEHRRRRQAAAIKKRAPDEGKAVYWLLWSIPWAALLAAAWIVEKSKAFGARIVRFFKEDLRQAPGRVKAGAEASGRELSSARGRRALLRGLFDERGLTQRRRIALLFLCCVFLGLAWIIMEILTLIFWAELLSFKHETDLLLFYGIGTRLFLPTPFEVLLLRSANVIGAPTAILVASIGATVGSWILFIVGTQANKGLKTWMNKRHWTKRSWGWLERNAERFGYVLMGLILSIPFAPDAVTAVFTLLGLQMRWFLLTIFLATILRLALFLWLFA
jgi:membrane protein YqaA with SNARE-associated domain